MKKLQNNFTTPEQSKRLLELGVPADSADCAYRLGINEFVKMLILIPKYAIYTAFADDCIFRVFKDRCIPCWSAGRPMEIIAECYQIDMPFRYFVRGGMMESLINTFMELRGEFDFSKLEE